MKYSLILNFILIVSLVSVVLNNNDDKIQNKVQIKKDAKTIAFYEKIIIKGSTRDSLIREHYSKCSFILNDEVIVGFDNYLRKDPNFNLAINE